MRELKRQHKGELGETGKDEISRKSIEENEMTTIQNIQNGQIALDQISGINAKMKEV